MARTRDGAQNRAPRAQKQAPGPLVDLSLDVGPLSLSLSGVAYSAVPDVAARLLELRATLLASHPALRPIVESLPGGTGVYVEDVDGGRMRVGF